MIPLRDTQPSYSRPYITIGIILLNVLAFLYEVSLDGYARDYLISTLGVVPRRFAVGDILTSMFLHGGWMHLIGNMWFLWIYGDNVEDILGHGKYLLFYLLCGAAASLVHVFFNAGSSVPAIGASGAIAGVMGAYLVKFPHARILMLFPIIIIWTTIEVPAVLVLLYWFFLQIFSGVGEVAYAAATRSGGGVAWFAHIGGFVAGALLIWLLPTQQPYHTRRELRW